MASDPDCVNCHDGPCDLVSFDGPTVCVKRVRSAERVRRYLAKHPNVKVSAFTCSPSDQKTIGHYASLIPEPLGTDDEPTKDRPAFDLGVMKYWNQAIKCPYPSLDTLIPEPLGTDDEPTKEYPKRDDTEITIVDRHTFMIDQDRSPFGEIDPVECAKSFAPLKPLPTRIPGPDVCAMPVRLTRAERASMFLYCMIVAAILTGVALAIVDHL